MNKFEKAIYDEKRNNYKKTDLSLYDRFWAQEKESEQWLNDVIKAQKEKNEVLRQTMLHELSLDGKINIDLKRNSIDKLIDMFTKSAYSDEEIDKFIDNFNKTSIFENGRRVDREALIFDLDGKKTVVRTLTVASPDLVNYFPELLTDERTCKCHEGSIHMARTLNIEGRKVTTGSYYLLSPMSMVLHSVAEVNIEGNDFVVDYESNTLWEKEDFYKFYNFEPFESIPWETINKDMNDLVFLANTDKDYTKLYLTSRNEAIQIAKELQNQNKA